MSSTFLDNIGHKSSHFQKTASCGDPLSEIAEDTGLDIEAIKRL
jgi:hypothetical protein